MRVAAYAARQSGLSLVELMVGMLIGLIGIVIISHLFITNEQYKRSTTGSGAAQVNGAIALYSIERDLRMAGYGINHEMALGCECAGAGCSPLQYHYDGNYPPAGGLNPLRLAPVIIVNNADLSQKITIMAAGDSERTRPTSLRSSTPTAEDPLNVDLQGGISGFEANNLVAVTQGTVCALAQVTAPGGGPLVTGVLERGSASKYNPSPSGLPTFTTGAAVFNLGASPTWRTYSIENNKLRMADVLPSAPAVAGQELVDDIVDLQALYGLDNGAGGTPDDGIVDTFSAAAPTTAAGWLQVKAVRIAVLARSQNYEKPSVPGGPCDATTPANAPTWNGGTAFPAKNFTGTSEDRCYKYRVFETIVPLRNMIWS